MNRILLAAAVLSLTACDPGPVGPSLLTTATQPMAQQTNGMSITAAPGEDALWATGEHGVVAAGSAYEGVVGIGAPGAAGGWFRSGTAPTASEPQAGVWTTGSINFQDTPAPAPNIPITNAVTPGNLLSVSAKIRTVDGVATLLGGFNVASVTVVGPYTLRLRFAAPFADANYVCVSNVGNSYASGALPNGQTTSGVDIGALSGFASGERVISVICTGRQ